MIAALIGAAIERDNQCGSREATSVKRYSGAMKVTCVGRNCVRVREREMRHTLFVLLQTVIVHNLSYSSFLPKVHVYCRYSFSSLCICVNIVFVSLFAYRIWTIGFLRTMQYVENMFLLIHLIPTAHQLFLCQLIQCLCTTHACTCTNSLCCLYELHIYI